MSGERVGASQRLVEAAMAALADGRIDAVRAEDRDVRALVWVAQKEQDRYLVVTKDSQGTAREEWRSGGWIRRMLERGHWGLLEPLPDARPSTRARWVGLRRKVGAWLSR